jgi:hypothetical protein
MESNLTETLIEEKRKIYRAILYKYSIGEYLKGQDFDNLLDLLKKHPRSVQKIGVGIKGLLVDSDGYGGRCFYLIRQDGTKENFSYLKCLSYKNIKREINTPQPQETKQLEIIKVNPEPIPAKNNTSDKGVAKATAKAAKITLVLDPASITKVDSTGQKQTKLKITVDAMVFEVDLNSKSYRKAIASIDELGVDNCNAILQGAMKEKGKIEGAGLAVQPKKAKEESKEEVKQES